jgi:hypothetical protein
MNWLSDSPYPRSMLMERLMTRRYVNSLLLHQEREVDVGVPNGIRPASNRRP